MSKRMKNLCLVVCILAFALCLTLVFSRASIDKALENEAMVKKIEGKGYTDVKIMNVGHSIGSPYSTDLS